MRFQPTLIAAQPLVNTLTSGIKCQLWILSFTSGLQYRSGIETHETICDKSGALLFHSNVARIPATEIFGDHFSHPLFDFDAESIADVHMFSRYTQTHDTSPSL